MAQDNSTVNSVVNNETSSFNTRTQGDHIDDSKQKANSEDGWFSGRLNRGAYFGRLIVIFIISILVNVIVGIAAESSSSSSSGLLIFIIPLSIILAIYAIGCHVKRFHDIGKSGSWVILMFIPLVGIIVLLYLIFAPGISKSDGKYKLSDMRNDNEPIIKIESSNIIGSNDIVQCANCERKIGKLEDRYMFQNQIVCNDCNQRLNANYNI